MSKWNIPDQVVNALRDTVKHSDAEAYYDRYEEGLVAALDKWIYLGMAKEARVMTQIKATEEWWADNVNEWTNYKPCLIIKLDKIND